MINKRMITSRFLYLYTIFGAMQTILFKSSLFLAFLVLFVFRNEEVFSQKILQDTTSFSFCFISDIHIQPELNATERFITAIDTINHHHPDFVITGGDLVSDALEHKQNRVDSLFNLYIATVKNFKMPVYNAIGNHDVFGWFPKSGVSASNPYYGKKMFEAKLGKRYQSFTHKGWKFMILDAIDLSDSGIYKGGIDSIQMVWIQSELAKTSKNTPIAIAMHIPLITTFYQIKQGSMAPNTRGLVVENSKKVLDLFKGYNLKLVLQGHLHMLEDDYTYGIHFIIGGAISGEWWKGPHEGTPEGIMLLHIKNENITYEYIPYEWKSKN